MLSHIKAVGTAKERGWRSVLIFEDDVELMPNFLFRLKHYMDKLPSEWWALFLAGGQRRVTVDYNSHLIKAKGVYGGYAYVLNECSYEWLLSEWRKLKEPNDNTTVTMQDLYPCFKTKQPLVRHVGNFSDRQNKEVNY